MKGEMNLSETKCKNDYVRGLKDGLPIAIGYVPISMACGISASSAGITFFVSQLMSLLIYSGSGQATAINLFAGGEASILMYGITLFVMNCRYMLFSMSLAQRIDPSMSLFQKMLVGAFNTDEIFGVAIREKGDISAKYFLGVATLPYIGFLIGSVLGSISAGLLPDSVVSAMGIMLFALFIAIIVPPAKESRNILWVVLMALGLSVILECRPVVTKHLTSGWIIIICAIVTSLVCAICFPVEDEGEEV